MSGWRTTVISFDCTAPCTVCPSLGTCTLKYHAWKIPPQYASSISRYIKDLFGGNQGESCEMDTLGRTGKISGRNTCPKQVLCYLCAFQSFDCCYFFFGIGMPDVHRVVRLSIVPTVGCRGSRLLEKCESQSDYE